MSKLVISVQPLDGYILELFLNNGDIKNFDMKPYLQYPVFKSLQDINIFKSVKVDELGGIEWNLDNGASLSQDTLLAKMY